MAKVLLQNVTKKLGDVAAVKDVTLEARDGEFLVLLGPSGSGKTTLLRLVAGLEEPTSGNIFIGDRKVNSVPPEDRNVAMVFESPTYGIYPHMTAYNNMAFGLRFRKHLPFLEKSKEGSTQQVSKEERQVAIQGRVGEVAERLGLTPYLQMRANQLSGGHSQGVALGRSLAVQPDVFLMDDPLSQFDAQMHVAARVELRRLHRSLGTTIIYVSHDQADAMALGDRVAVMNEGTLQQIALPQTLYNRPANMFVAGFIGTPPMNMLAVTAEDEGGSIYLKGDGFRVIVPDYLAQRLPGLENRQIVLGLRPEAICDPQYAKAANPETLVDTRVIQREFTGEDVYLHLALGLQEIVARVDGRTWAWPPEPFRVAFDMDHMYAFDPVTGNALL